MKPSCPVCHKTFGLFSAPHLLSWRRSSIRDLHCCFCQAPLKIQRSRSLDWLMMMLGIILLLTVFGARGLFWRFFTPATALTLWGALTFALVFAYLAIAMQRVRYEPRV